MGSLFLGTFDFDEEHFDWGDDAARAPHHLKVMLCSSLGLDQSIQEGEAHWGENVTHPVRGCLLRHATGQFPTPQGILDAAVPEKSICMENVELFQVRVQICVARSAVIYTENFSAAVSPLFFAFLFSNTKDKSLAMSPPMTHTLALPHHSSLVYVCV